MPNLVTVDNHLAITLSSEVEQICKPLFTCFEISFFNYVRIFYDGQRLSLSNRSDWLEHYYNNQFQNRTVFKPSKEMMQDRYFLWDSADCPIVQVAGEEFNIAHGFTLIVPKDTYCEFFHFATDRKNIGLTNFYVNNVDIFERFATFFLEQGEDLIKKPKPYMPTEIIQQVKSLKDINIVNKIMGTRDKFFNDTIIKKCKFKIHNRDILLSRREIECIAGLLSGKTMKEIGKILFLSPRTVECYLRSIKGKLDCHTKSELIKLIEQTDFKQKFTSDINSIE